MIAKDNRTPLYYQLMDIIVEQIETGNLQEHDKLPSERELCEIHDVSRTTVRQTMQELEKEIRLYMGICHDCPNYARIIHFLYVANFAKYLF